MDLLICKLGRIGYQEAFDLQQHLVGLRQQNAIGDILLVLEHPPVITVGTSGSSTNILASDQVLKSQGIELYPTNRGGDVTYHGPGQMVGYPIIDLTGQGKDIRSFVRRLEEVFIRMLREEYGITAGRDPKNTGVWVGNEKITAIGLAVKRWVTMHGFAFNINTDLNHFRWIIPCGIAGKGVTSLERLLGKACPLEDVMDQVADYFCRVFGYRPVSVGKQQLLDFIQER